jgi:hypothetical protein
MRINEQIQLHKFKGLTLKNQVKTDKGDPLNRKKNDAMLLKMYL